MDYDNIKNLFCEYSFKLISLLILVLLLVPHSLGADFIVSPSNKMVSQGQTFDLDIYLDPKGSPVAGAQLNIEYNGSILKINNIKEGDFLKQTGANTFFNSGAINNSLGKVINIFDAILGPASVSTPGKFVIINATAIGSSGSSNIYLSNVKISDQNSKKVAVNLINGRIEINNGGIAVTSPNGGETWPRGTTKTIRWTYSGTPGSNVRIELMKGGVVNRIINSSVPVGSGGTGSYSWRINSTQTPGTNYKVRVTSSTNAVYTDTSNNNFTIRS